MLGPKPWTWLERNRVGYIFGLAGNRVLLGKVAPLAEDAAVEPDRRRGRQGPPLRRIRATPPRPGTSSGGSIARVEASAQGTDSRFIVTNLKGAPRWLYEEVYCARGQAENLIKAHKLHLASDRTSCSRATANQFRLLIHTAAYWLLHTLRGLAPKASFWRDAQFDTIRLALIKVAGRVTEIGHPDQGGPAVLLPLPGQPHRSCPPAPPSCRPDRRGCVPRPSPCPATPSPDSPRNPRHRSAGPTSNQNRRKRDLGE